MRIFMYYMATTASAARSRYMTTDRSVLRCKKSIGAMVDTMMAMTTSDGIEVEGSSAKVAPRSSTAEIIKSHIWRTAGFCDLPLMM